jgi:hypothetical protein
MGRVVEGQGLPAAATPPQGHVPQGGGLGPRHDDAVDVVGDREGAAPSQAAVAPHRQARQAGDAGPEPVVVADPGAHLQEERGKLVDLQVRVAAQERLAGGRPATVHGPGVAAAADPQGGVSREAQGHLTGLATQQRRIPTIEVRGEHGRQGPGGAARRHAVHQQPLHALLTLREAQVGRQHEARERRRPSRHRQLRQDQAQLPGCAPRPQTVGHTGEVGVAPGGRISRQGAGRGLATPDQIEAVDQGVHLQQVIARPQAPRQLAARRRVQEQRLQGTVARVHPAEAKVGRPRVFPPNPRGAAHVVRDFWLAMSHRPAG